MKLVKLLILGVFLTYFSCNSPYQKGQTVYEQHCGNCHGKNGEGLRKLYPPITDELYKMHEDKLACMIRYGYNKGLEYNGVTYTAEMPGNDVLTDIDIVNLINYLDWKYGENKEFNRLIDVKKKLDDCN